MKKMFLAFATSLLVSAAFAQDLKQEVFSNQKGAINGYDPVAYFTENKPMKGNHSLSFKWNNATWYFASKGNLESFKANPEKYAPQFGGYCAYGLSQGKKAPTDPAAFTIVDDKLYLNYNATVKQMWLKDEKNYIMMANNNWPNLKDKAE
jgi:YHS domain-containing protein